MGAIEISESDPNIIYVGTGEPQMRNNVSWGDGVYKSIDGGDTWTPYWPGMIPIISPR